MRSPTFALVCVAATLTLLAVGSEGGTNVRLEMWDGCLCAGPAHSRSYEQLEAERVKRMLFGTNVTVTPVDGTLAPLSFLRKHLAGSKLESRTDFYRKVVIYRQATNGTYSVLSRSPRLMMSDTKEGDLILYYMEVY